LEFPIFELYRKLLNFCLCKEKVVFCVIAVLCLASFAVPCADQVVVFVIFMAYCKAVRRQFADQAPVSVVFPLLFCSGAAGLFGSEILV